MKPIRKRTTNKRQFQRLKKIMKENPDMACNVTKHSMEHVQKFWDNIRRELNSLGPPEKYVSEWKKVWADCKSFLRRKVEHNIREWEMIANGSVTRSESKLHKLSESDRELIDILGATELAEALQNAKRKVVSATNTSTNNTIDIDTDDNPPTTSTASPNSCTSPKIEIKHEINDVDFDIEIESPQIQELHHQDRIQCNNAKKPVEFKNTFNLRLMNMLCANKDHLAAHGNTLKEIADSLECIKEQARKQTEIAEEQLDETRRHNRVMESRAVVKVELKKKLLEFELKQLNSKFMNE